MTDEIRYHTPTAVGLSSMHETPPNKNTDGKPMCAATRNPIQEPATASQNEYHTPASAGVWYYKDSNSSPQNDDLRPATCPNDPPNGESSSPAPCTTHPPKRREDAGVRHKPDKTVDTINIHNIVFGEKSPEKEQHRPLESNRHLRPPFRQPP
ncbi:hypothetical protein BS47DRAFT_1357158 [Hydnum rufescens UP504]|uniref:Uncharacterized protein n=1 Tax=Hydnum rufescens UP504 TaxID=1448309 RepID=A0A9P6BAI0_9AGAM|nr:hypothetical protein BS47DRAFT_1357158 [Hydnum rufescens UP504]